LKRHPFARIISKEGDHDCLTSNLRAAVAKASCARPNKPLFSLEGEEEDESENIEVDVIYSLHNDLVAFAHISGTIV
jgi:hypothetical protein